MEIKRRNIKEELQESIDEIEKEYYEFQQNVNFWKIYSIICEMFEPTDIDELITASLSFPALYECVVDKEVADKLSKELLEKLYFIKKVNKKNYQDLYDTKRKMQEFNDKIKGFKKKRDELEKEIKENKKRIYEKKNLQRKYCFIKSKLDHQGLLTGEDITFLADFMIKKEFTREQQILGLEYLRIHNQKIKHPDYTISNQVRDMLHSKYHEIEITERQDLAYTRYQSDVFSYQKAFENSKDVKEVIEMLKNSEKNYKDKEAYLYILKSLVNIYVRKLNEDIEDLKECYEDLELRKVILATYNEHRKKYTYLRTFYFEKQKEPPKEETPEEETPEEEVFVNFLLYPGTGTPYLERDLKDIPNEKLMELKELLLKKKRGTLSKDEDQALTGSDKLTGLRELRGDQIRICYRHLGGNMYAIMGAFIKKSDNLRAVYEAMAKRKVNIEISDEEGLAPAGLNSQATEQKIFDFIDKNYRKGSR